MKRQLLLYLCVIVPLFLAAQPKVIISEIAYEHYGTYDDSTCNDGSCNGKFISLYNYGATSVDISRWKLVSGHWNFHTGVSEPSEFTFPEGSVMQPCAKFLVVYIDRAFRFSDLYPSEDFGANDRIFYQNSLDFLQISTDVLELRRADGAMQEEITYFDFPQILPNPSLPLLSLTRFNVTKENGRIVFLPEDYVANTLALSGYPSSFGLSENGTHVTPNSSCTDSFDGDVEEVWMNSDPYPKVIIGKVASGLSVEHLEGDPIFGKYIVLYNYGCSAVDLSGWQLERITWNNNTPVYSRYTIDGGVHAVIKPQAKMVVFYFDGQNLYDDFSDAPPLRPDDVVQESDVVLLHEGRFETLWLLRAGRIPHDEINFDDALAAAVVSPNPSGVVELVRHNVTRVGGQFVFMPEDYTLNDHERLMDDSFSWLTEGVDGEEPKSVGGSTDNPDQEPDISDDEDVDEPDEFFDEPDPFPRVAISELLYDTPLSERSGDNRYNGEFVSLYNYGRDTVNISGWRLVSDGTGQSFTFPTSSLMPPHAKYVVAYRNVNGAFQLEHLYSNIAWKSRDRIFYQRAIIHANDGESVRLYRRDGYLQDSLYYEGDSQKSKSPRLEAYNGEGLSSSLCVSLQRNNVTVSDGNIQFNPADYTTAKVALTQYPTSAITENGEPLPAPSISFTYDLSGNRTSHLVVMPVYPTYTAFMQAATMLDTYGDTTDISDTSHVDITATDMMDRSDVTIYPNPTSGSLAVEVQNMLQDVQYKLVVYTMFGVPVFQQNSMSSYTTIDLSPYPQGLYTLRIASPTSYLEWRILKQ